MNSVVLSGRLTRDPEIKSGAENKVASYTLAVDKGYKVNEGEPGADFIRCVTFGKNAEFAEKYLHKGIKIIVTGRINTGSYVNSDGVKVYTTDVVVNTHEFCESKSAAGSTERSDAASPDGFMRVPDGIENEEVPWM